MVRPTEGRRVTLSSENVLGLKHRNKSNIY